MKRLVRFYNNRSIQSKMMIIILLVLAMTVFSLSLMNLNVLNRSFAEITNDQAIEMASQVTDQIENYILQSGKTLDFILSEPSVHRFFSGTLGNEDEVLATLSRYTDNDRHIAGILLVDKHGEMLSNSMYTLEDYPLTLEDWYIETAADVSSFHVYAKTMGRNVSSFYDTYKADNTLSLAKALTDDDGQVVGVILLDMKLDRIESIINDAVLSKEGFLYIADKNGKVVYAPANDVVYRIHPTMLDNHSFVEIGSNRYQITLHDVGILRWKIVGVFSQDETLRILIEVIIYFIIYAIVIFGIAVALFSVLTKTLTKPIGKLQDLMVQAELGELNVVFESRYNDEISELGRRFNSMIGSIKNLLQMVYQEQQAKREAELKAFQAQIKPHFLYNTLDTISWMALEYEADDIADVVQSLTNLFRISLSKGNEIISLENEILHISSYLSIQKVRYEDQFDYEISWDKSLGDLKVIKLIIQPIVENAIYHGIKGSRKAGFIHILVETKSEDLLIYVTDNGHGMDEVDIAYLNSMFEDSEKKKETTGIGLMNVNERIKINFGPDYGLKVIKANGEGTTVMIRHPMI